MNENPTTIHNALDTLASQLGAETILELVDIYSENSTLQLSKVQAAVAAGNHAGVTAEAHSLKSSSANMGAEVLAKVCLQIEKSKSLDAATLALIETAKSLQQEAVAAMQKWKSNLK